MSSIVALANAIDKENYNHGAQLGAEKTTNEYKMHSIMTIEEVSMSWQWYDLHYDKLRRTKQSVSKSVCAMLNSARGGVIRLGVHDGGTVKGLPLSESQRHHVLLSLNDALSRYTPTIPKNAVRVQWHRVLHANFNKGVRRDPNMVAAHTLRADPMQCCCARSAARHKTGSLYVLRITVDGQLIDSEEENKRIKTAPKEEMLGKYRSQTYYANEEGLCHMRRTLTNAQMTLDHIAEYERMCMNAYTKRLEELSATDNRIEECAPAR